MVKKYKTSGRTLGNYRGRTGTLMLVPTRKAEGPTKPFVVTETYGIACRVLAADANDEVIAIESEPEIPLDAVPSGKLHLDLRLRRFDGTRHFVEVRDEKFATEEGIRRLGLAEQAITQWGDTFEFELRRDVVNSIEAKGLQFLFRFRNSTAPAPSELTVAFELIAERSSGRLTEWLRAFSRRRLPARVLYWAIANQKLAVADGERLFPDGRLVRNAN